MRGISRTLCVGEGRRCFHSNDEGVWPTLRIGRCLARASQSRKRNRSRAQKDMIDPSDEIMFQKANASG